VFAVANLFLVFILPLGAWPTWRTFHCRHRGANSTITTTAFVIGAALKDGREKGVELKLHPFSLSIAP